MFRNGICFGPESLSGIFRIVGPEKGYVSDLLRIVIIISLFRIYFGSKSSSVCFVSISDRNQSSAGNSISYHDWNHQVFGSEFVSGSKSSSVSYRIIFYCFQFLDWNHQVIQIVVCSGSDLSDRNHYHFVLDLLRIEIIIR